MKKIILAALLVTSANVAMAADDIKSCSAICLGLTSQGEILGAQPINKSGKSEIDAFNQVAVDCRLTNFGNASVTEKLLVISYRTTRNRIIGGSDEEAPGNFLRFDKSLVEANVRNCQARP